MTKTSSKFIKVAMLCSIVAIASVSNGSAALLSFEVTTPGDRSLCNKTLCQFKAMNVVKNPNPNLGYYLGWVECRCDPDTNNPRGAWYILGNKQQCQNNPETCAISSKDPVSYCHSSHSLIKAAKCP